MAQHQRLSNLLQEKKWGEAVKLALRLSQPLTALRIIRKLDTGELAAAVTSLDHSGLDQLLGYIVQVLLSTHLMYYLSQLYYCAVEHEHPALCPGPGCPVRGAERGEPGPAAAAAQHPDPRGAAAALHGEALQPAAEPQHQDQVHTLLAALHEGHKCSNQLIFFSRCCYFGGCDLNFYFFFQIK